MEHFILWLGLVGTLCGILFGYAGYRRGLKMDIKRNVETESVLKTDIEYIKRRTDDVLFEQKELNKNFNVLSERVTRVEESLKQADSRLDKLERI